MARAGRLSLSDGFIYLEKTKTENTREIPINEEFVQVLKEIRKPAVP